MAGRKITTAAVICALIILVQPFGGGAAAQPDQDYVSHPSHIPLFDDYSTPQIKPGSGGSITFTITNRYEYNITGLRLGLEIYRFANLDTGEALDHQDEVPGFRSGTAGAAAGEADGPSIDFVVPGRMGHHDTLEVRAKLHAPVFAELGTYLVRTYLIFEMENATYNMYSRGHFPDTPWYEYEKQKNLTKLAGQSGLPGLDGIIPDTSFGVKEPTDYTAFWIIIAVIAIFAVLSVFFYLMDERGKFPGTKKKMDDTWDRMRGRG